jgi:predicted nuclease of predicted toxin-antitoxin system
MKLLLDAGMPRSAAGLLQAAGIDAVHVGDVGHATSEDEIILQFARDNDRIVVTLDADFHTLLALSGASTPSVIRIRIEGLRAQELVEVLHKVLAQCSADLQHGAAVSVQETRIRIRHLPILHQ